MVDFPSPIDPFEHVRIAKVKETIEEKEKREPIIPKGVSKKLFIYFTFLKIVSNILAPFRQKTIKSIDGTPLHKEIVTIKSSLNSLKEKNLCQDLEFLNYFAFVWLKFLKDYDYYVLKNAEATKLIQKLVDEINLYPKNAEFSLGYYISEFAGYKWIPFPYMEMLQNLHIENTKDPENSHLTKWIEIIDKLLKLL
ncbi:MAG: hypothetical protein KR126chlam6_01168 [Candidatus Anoxychlamydiales bacterium]|nr:hypothetical protein [Candidatus Anoxychlamydiales bacterium]